MSAPPSAERDDALKQRDDANRRATEAEKQRDGARDALQAAKLRGDKLKAENDALRLTPSRPRSWTRKRSTAEPKPAPTS